jgi:hypothetical protein
MPTEKELQEDFEKESRIYQLDYNKDVNHYADRRTESMWQGFLLPFFR